MSDEILGVANLGEIDRLYRVYVTREPKSRLRKIGWILGARGDYIGHSVP